MALKAEASALKRSKRQQSQQGQQGKAKKPRIECERKRRPEEKEKPKWMSFPPKPNELTKPREWNNKKWHWCSPQTGGKCKGRWTVHKPADCKGYLGSRKPEEKPKAKLAKASQAILEEDTDKEEKEEQQEDEQDNESTNMDLSDMEYQSE